MIIREEELWRGFVIVAAVPPAVAVIPFTGFLNGNVTFSLIGTLAAYLGALVITPLIENYGLAAGLSLALFSKQTAVPATVSVFFLIVYIIWLGFKKRYSKTTSRVKKTRASVSLSA